MQKYLGGTCLGLQLLLGCAVPSSTPTIEIAPVIGNSAETPLKAKKTVAEIREALKSRTVLELWRCTYEHGLKPNGCEQALANADKCGQREYDTLVKKHAKDIPACASAIQYRKDPNNKGLPLLSASMSCGEAIRADFAGELAAVKNRCAVAARSCLEITIAESNINCLDYGEKKF